MKSFIYPSRIKDSNLGDVLINALLIREISKFGKVFIDGKVPSLYDLVTLNNPFAKNIVIVEGIKAFEGKPVLRWLNLASVIGKVDFVFDPPGAYFEGKDAAKAKFKFYKYFLRAVVLKTAKIGVLRWGVSLGPYSDGGYADQRKLSNVYTDIAVRDSNNYDHLKEKGFNNLSLIDDLAFLYDIGNFQAVIDRVELDYKGDNYVVVSIRGDIEGKELNKAYLDQIAVNLMRMFADTIVKNEEIVLAYQVVEDLESLQYLKDILERNNYKCKLLDKQLSFAQAIGLYAGARFLYTNRLHVALLSILNNTVPIILTDLKLHHKLVNVFKDLDLEALLIDTKPDAEIKFSIDAEHSYLEKFIHFKKQKAKTITDHFGRLFLN
ncbi:polysaccharide pyruvyl transferase family protein [Pedobacter panaciterrae]|uniref:polysaccharide pyruvyl transferase family protein n=1 Tax=Pedobacter panaciterrae TaxID=363849 RepID=UPI00259208E1|nr:polysaccharide pyruvyl transferase family protein [uncultured Pedobacter sp.]